MVWTVEDGTLIDGSNTYVDTSDAIDYAAARGITISSEEIDVLMQKAMDYLETRNYDGTLTEEDQSLQQPRENVYINGYLQTATQLVARMSKAECELIMAFKAGYDPLLTITNSQQVIHKRFDVFEKTYKEGSTTTPILQRLNSWLDPLLASSNNGVTFSIIRSYA